MTDTPTLFDVPLPPPGLNAFGMAHRNARPTEREAARLIAPATGTQRARVLAEIRTAGEYGRTDEELAARLEMSLNSVRPRRVELIEMGWVHDSGSTRKTPAGRDATVWTLTEEALSA